MACLQVQHASKAPCCVQVGQEAGGTQPEKMSGFQAEKANPFLATSLLELLSSPTPWLHASLSALGEDASEQSLRSALLTEVRKQITSDRDSQQSTFSEV
jgi:hypothetical protein